MQILKIFVVPLMLLIVMPKLKVFCNSAACVIDSISDNFFNTCSCLPDVGQSRRHVSAREYYCYNLQIRPGEFNITLHGGRLFQQYVVDMYVKVESMRLDWYSKPENQKIIRADLYKVTILCLSDFYNQLDARMLILNFFIPST